MFSLLLYLERIFSLYVYWVHDTYLQRCNEKPQVVNDYEAGRGIPNQAIIGKMERVLGKINFYWTIFSVFYKRFYFFVLGISSIISVFFFFCVYVNLIDLKKTVTKNEQKRHFQKFKNFSCCTYLFCKQSSA